MTYKHDVTVRHVCGHDQTYHVESISPDPSDFIGSMAQRRCDTCHPRCQFCGRSGPRERMLVSPDGRTWCNEWCADQSLRQTHFSEYNDIPVPPFVTRLGFVDRSYHNDLCARAEYELTGTANVTVWVAQDDVADREWEGMPKYSVLYLADEDAMEKADTVYEGDSAADAEAACAALIAKYGPRRKESK